MLIKNCEILYYKSKDDYELRFGDIAIEDAKIKYLGKIPEDFVTDEVIDAKGKLAIPGLINAHTHSYANFFKGMGENLPLEVWMYYAFLAGKLRTEDIYISTMLGCIDMIRSGVTTCLDHLAVGLEGIDSALNAYIDAGMGVVMSPMVTDKQYFDTLPVNKDTLPDELLNKINKNKSKTATEVADFCEEVITKWHGKNNGLIRVMPGPSGPQRCTDELLINFRDLANKYDLGIHTHLVETKIQAITAHDLFGCSMVEYLNNLGVLNDKWSMAHTVWVSDNDMKLLKESGASVVHNPVSNLTIGSGISPINEMYKNNINIGLGTDGSNCGGNQNIFGAMNQAAIISKITTPKYEDWQSAINVFRMATENGAKAIKLGSELGSIEIGKRADIVLIDTKSVYLTPRVDIINQLVYNDKGQSVDTVIINGKVVMENKELLTINEKKVIEEAQNRFDSLEDRINNSLKQSSEEMVYVDKVYKQEINRELGFQRTGDWNVYK